MIFNRFYVLVVLQIFLITAVNFFIIWSFNQAHLQFTAYYFIIVLIIQISLLFKFISKNNREVSEFLEVFKYNDNLSKLRTDGKQKSQKQLRFLLNQIAESYSNVRIEKESGHHYFLSTIKHVNIGLISFDESGKIELMNEAFENLFHIKNIRFIDSLNKLHPGFTSKLLSLQPGKPQLFKMMHHDNLLHLSLNVAEFAVKGKRISLVSVQDIKAELQQEEIDLWQKLIRVLTHEIMNSAGPITSLSSTLVETINEKAGQDEIVLDRQSKENMLLGLNAIEKRSRGLAKFVENYRSLTRLPKPNFEEILLSDFFDHIHVLLREELEEQNISVKFVVEPQSLSLLMDEKLISQVMINLMRNAMQALHGIETPCVDVHAFADQQNAVLVEVKDNGPGIPDEYLDKIFIPFFTTKENGSGIGLSLARQVMNMHKGSINVRSQKGKGARFILKF